MSDVPIEDDFERELLSSWKSMKAPEGAYDKAVELVTTAAVVTTAVAATATIHGVATKSIAAAASQTGQAGATKAAGTKLLAKLVAKLSTTFNLGAGAGAAGTGAAVAAPIATGATGLVAKVVITSALVATTAVGVGAGVPAVRKSLNAHSPDPTKTVVVPAVAAPSAAAPLREGPGESVVAPPEKSLPQIPEEAPTPEVLEETPVDEAPIVKPTSAARTTKTSSKSEASSKNEAPSKSVASLTEALDAIHEARAALSRGDSQGALKRLATIGDDSPLAAEATALRFDAYVRSGQKDAAKATATKLVERFPASAYAAKARRALEDDFSTPANNE